MESTRKPFLRNNAGIDFAELDQRLQLVERNMPEPPTQQVPRSYVPQASPPSLPARQSPSLTRKLGEFAACLLRLRRIREWAEIGRDTRTYAEAIQHDVVKIGEVLAAHEEQFRSAQRELAELRSFASTLARQNEELRREIMFQQRRLTKLLANVPPEAEKTITAELFDSRLEALYVAFEDRFRGHRADIKQRLRSYLEPIRLVGAGSPDFPIVDLGCGRGEWIELLKEEQLSAYGIDGNAMMCERARSMGLDARREDLMQHLNALPDACRSAVTAFHVVEHLPFDTLIDFLDEALRVLIPGGVLILETPNPETMKVGATTFYYDPTHLNPLPALPLSFMVEHRGFVEIEVIKKHPFTEGLLEAKTADAKLLNTALFGPQDYAIIARRS